MKPAIYFPGSPPDSKTAIEERTVKAKPIATINKMFLPVKTFISKSFESDHRYWGEVNFNPVDENATKTIAVISNPPIHNAHPSSVTRE